MSKTNERSVTTDSLFIEMRKLSPKVTGGIMRAREAAYEEGKAAGQRWSPLVGQFDRGFKVENFVHHAAVPKLPCPGRGKPQYASSGVRSARLE